MNFPIKKRYLALLVLTTAFLLGPKPSYPKIESKIPKLEMPLEKLDAYIAQKEATIAKLKPDNESRIVWADSIRKTPFSVVYLHGFSASPKEGDPIHREFAKRYGCNLYIPRLAGHGIDDIESFKELTPKALMDSAREAIAIGQLIGEEVILMSCSTGSTLGIYLSANNPKSIHAHLMYSPNIDLEDPKSNVMLLPWGLQLSRAFMGSEYRSIAAVMPPETHNYWTITYRLEGLIAVKHLLAASMTDATFKKVQEPIMVGYYFKNEAECDHIISIDGLKRFYELAATPSDKKRLVAFPNVASHVVVSGLQSKDIADVRAKTFAFTEEVLGLEVRIED